MQDTARNDYAVIDVRRNDHSVIYIDFYFFTYGRLTVTFREVMCEEVRKFRRRHFTTISLNSSKNTVRKSMLFFTARVRGAEDLAVPAGM